MREKITTSRGFRRFTRFTQHNRSRNITGIRIGLQRALVVLEVLPGTLALSIGRLSEPHGGWSRIA